MLEVTKSLETVRLLKLINLHYWGSDCYIKVFLVLKYHSCSPAFSKSKVRGAFWYILGIVIL